MNLPIRIRASEADRVFWCHGSLLLAPLVPRKEGKEGMEGAALHYEIAARCVNELGATPPEGGLIVSRLPKGYKIPGFSTWITDWAFQHVKETIPEDWSLLVEAEFAYRLDLPRPIWIPTRETMGPIDPKEFRIEHRPEFDTLCALITHVIITGHTDILALNSDCTRMKGKDWKTGTVGADAAEQNWQAAMYIVLAKLAWPELEEAEFELCQPKIDSEETGIDRITTVVLKGKQLDAMVAEIANQINMALEDRFTTDSSMKACKYCPVCKARPMDCPSLQAENQAAQLMKSKLTPELIDRLKSAPNDALIGDFVMSGRTLESAVKAAEDLLHERIDQQGYLDAGNGTRITRKTQRGSIKVTEPLEYHRKLRNLIKDEARIADCLTPSKTRVIDNIAAVTGKPKTSANGPSATSDYDAYLAPHTEQGEKRILVFQ